MASQEPLDEEIKKLLDKATSEEDKNSSDYRAREVLDFITEQKLEDGNIKVPVVALYKAYSEWANKSHTPLNRDKFSEQFSKVFKQRKELKSYRYYKLNKDFPISLVEWQQFLRGNRKRHGSSKKEKA